MSSRVSRARFLKGNAGGAASENIGVKVRCIHIITRFTLIFEGCQFQLWPTGALDPLEIKTDVVQPDDQTPI